MDYQGYSVGWFTLAVINAGLAQSKQRSGWNWFFVSIFAGPLATLLIVAWPPGTPLRRWPRRAPVQQADGHEVRG